MGERITFDWDGIEIAGILGIPDGAKGSIPAFIVLHGFGANKDSGSVRPRRNCSPTGAMRRSGSICPGLAIQAASRAG